MKMTLFHRYKRLTLWNKLGVVASIFGILAFIITLITLPIFGGSKPHPHFTISLQIGDSTVSTVLLTNDFLFSGRIVNAGNLPNGSFMIKNYADGCLIIPVQKGESNKVFNFAVENNSSVKVTDLEVSAGFPKDWACMADPKWQRANVHLTIPGKWRFDFSNLQFFTIQSPWPLFPTDSLRFPSITNPCLPTANGGLFSLAIRSTDYNSMISANIVFVPVSSNYFKPFVTRGEIGSDGLLRLSTTQEEFEKSQK